MANTSTKNFPHAYGAGRCVAAFSLSHPGGPNEPEEADASRQGSLPPPAFRMDPLDVAALGYPDRSLSVTPNNSTPGAFDYTTQVGYTPDVQPFNATSFGVFATGTGLTSLPYRRALAPFCPNIVSPQISDVLPGTGPQDNVIRPFKVVEEVKLGSTRAQYVVQPVSPAIDTDPMDQGCCYYEVALDWTSPALTLDMTGFLTPTWDVKNNWATDAIASVRESLMRTLWVTASYGSSATSECNPLIDPSVLTPTVQFNNDLSLTGQLTSNPAPGTGWEAMYNPPLTYGGDPNPIGSASVVEPYVAPDPDVFALPVTVATAFPPRADIMLKVTSVRQQITNTDASGFPGPDSDYRTVMKLAPVVRVVLPMPQAESPDVVPAALPRTGLRASSEDQGFQPPCVNVQVWQKNSSATDGSTTPVYDIYSGWVELGGAGT